MEYGKGSWTGRLYRDVVAFSGESSTASEFAVIESERDFFLREWKFMTPGYRLKRWMGAIRLDSGKFLIFVRKVLQD